MATVTPVFANSQRVFALAETQTNPCGNVPSTWLWAVEQGCVTSLGSENASRVLKRWPEEHKPESDGSNPADPYWGPLRRPGGYRKL